MQAFDNLSGIALPLNRGDVDTDAIIPQHWLVTVGRSGLGAGLFGGWRYDACGHDRPDFVLNQPAYRQARIIVAGANYGCGSSREHAVWAHLDYGVRAVIAPSFGPIFYENSLNNSLLPVELAAATVATIMRQLLQRPGATCRVDLQHMSVTGPDGMLYRFGMNMARRRTLLEGIDDIGQSMGKLDRVTAFQARQLQDMPWLR